jgi:transposase
MSRKLYVGMDVHKDTIVIAVFSSAGREPEVLERVANDEKKLRRFFERLTRNGDEVHACYEASGAGYVIQRLLHAWGHACEVIAPSMIPTRPGEQRKHDKRDATQLARLYRAGELVAIRIPSEAEERVRDLVRCRETFQREILKSRHYILKFLARRGWIYREGSNWTEKHFSWIRTLLCGASLAHEDQVVVSEYLSLLEYKLQRRDELDRRIEELALRPLYRGTVARARGFRGIDTQAAMVLATEIGDWRRFEKPAQLMAYLGLVPREHSSGQRERKGSITKAGNSHCRHVLVQAAWSYRHPPRRSAALAKRQAGLPPDVVAHAWKAQQRLHKLFRRIADRKSSSIAAVAVARELAGFLWATMQTMPVETIASMKDAA